jgi:hypothetical protein
VFYLDKLLTHQQSLSTHLEVYRYLCESYMYKKIGFIIFAALVVGAVSFPQKSTEIFSVVVSIANKVVVERVADMPQVKEAVMKKVNVGVKGEV